MPLPVLVQNNEAGPTVFSDPPNNLAIEWQGKGDKNGEDVQYVPEDVVTSNVQFIRCLQRGIFALVDPSPEIRERLEKQAVAYRARRDSSEQAGAEALDRRDNSTVPLAVLTETEERDSEGKPKTTQTQVVMEARQRG